MWQKNHVIDWSGANILDRESHRKTRELRESIHIRKEVTCSSATSRDHMPDEVRRWQTKRCN